MKGKRKLGPISLVAVSISIAHIARRQKQDDNESCDIQPFTVESYLGEYGKPFSVDR
jgi:hypothetical protein